MGESAPPCDRGLVKSTFKDRVTCRWFVDCVLPLHHQLPHVTAAGQKFSDGAQQ